MFNGTGYRNRIFYCQYNGVRASITIYYVYRTHEKKILNIQKNKNKKHIHKKTQKRDRKITNKPKKTYKKHLTKNTSHGARIASHKMS